MQTTKFIVGIVLAFAGCVVGVIIPLGLILGIPISLFGTVLISSTNKDRLVKYIAIGIPAGILLLETILFLFSQKIIVLLNSWGILT